MRIQVLSRSPPRTRWLRRPAAPCGWQPAPGRAQRISSTSPATMSIAGPGSRKRSAGWRSTALPEPDTSCASDKMAHFALINGARFTTLTLPTGIHRAG